MHVGERDHHLGLSTLTVALAATSVARGVAARPLDEYHPMLFGRRDRTSAMTHLVSDVAGAKDICIVSHHSRPPQEGKDGFVARSQDNHEVYARQHGYPYRRFGGRVSGSNFQNPGRGQLHDKVGGGGHWQKFSALATVADEASAEGIPLCRWLMWIDSDAIVTNRAITLESIIHHFAEAENRPKDVILAQESSGWATNVINSGVFFVKNSWEGRAFLEGCARLYDRYKDINMYDQNAVQDYAFHRDPTTLKLEDHDTVLSQLRPRIAVAAQRVFNAFYWVNEAGEGLITLPAVYPAAVANWQPCDFIGHLPGLAPPDRLAAMDVMLQSENRC